MAVLLYLPQQSFKLLKTVILTQDGCTSLPSQITQNRRQTETNCGYSSGLKHVVFHYGRPHNTTTGQPSKLSSTLILSLATYKTSWSHVFFLHGKHVYLVKGVIFRPAIFLLNLILANEHLFSNLRLLPERTSLTCRCPKKQVFHN